MQWSLRVPRGALWYSFFMFYSQGVLLRMNKKPPKGTRLEVGTQLKIPFASFPDFDQLKNDEKYWAVRDVLDKIAKTRGQSACTCL